MQGLVAPTHEPARLTDMAHVCGMPGTARRNLVARALSLDMPEHFAPSCCLTALALAPQVVAAGPSCSRAARVPIWARAPILMLFKQRKCLNRQFALQTGPQGFLEALPERQSAIAPEDSRAGKHRRFGLGFKPKVAPPFLADT